MVIVSVAHQPKIIFACSIRQLNFLLLLLLAAVTYNQVQPLRINYLVTEFLPKLELYTAKVFYIHYSIDSVQHKNCINS